MKHTMASLCTILLDNIVYYPGQTINGCVECNFSSEETARGISVRFKGRTKIYWQERRRHYSNEETYFEMVSDLLKSETTFPPGKYRYPFTFTLPVEIPPSLTQTYGNTKYFVEAKVDRPWAIDYKEKRPFPVHSYIDLNTIATLRSPMVMDEVKLPMTLFNSASNASIRLAIHLPVRGFVPSQMVTFTAKVSNNSNINVQAVQFQLVQNFIFHSSWQNTKSLTAAIGPVFKVTDGLVSPGHEKSWNLELYVPPQMYAESLEHCKIIKCSTFVKGKAILPLLFRNLKLIFPIVIGSVPFQ